jgi:hypothetical protein
MMTWMIRQIYATNFRKQAVDGKGNDWQTGDPGADTAVPKGEKLAENFNTQTVYFSVYCAMALKGAVGGADSPTVISITDIAFVK